MRDRPKDLSWIRPTLYTEPSVNEFRGLLPQFQFENFQDPDVRKQNINLLRRVSSIDREIIDRKGGWIFPEKVYLDDPTYMTQAPEHYEDLDRFTLRQVMCHSLATRFQYVSEKLLPEYIERALKRVEQIRIASFGSGTGRDVMNAMGYFGNGVTADFYDLDSLALLEGEKIATQSGLQRRVKFNHQDITTINNGPYDIGIMVGVICPLQDTLAKRLLRSLRPNIKPNTGVFIVSSSSDKMEYDDLLSRFLIEYAANWYLQFRDAQRMERLGRESGLRTLEVTNEPLGHHKLAVYEHR